jgi:sec-independent protein translocase protein TatB
MLIAVVTLIVVGPQRLPGMLRTLGEWVRKLRRLTTEVRAQTGIDDILRQEGIDGGLAELRSMMRGDFHTVVRDGHHRRDDSRRPDDPYRDVVVIDLSREYPPEGVDSASALADDLVDEEVVRAAEPAAPVAAPNDRTGRATPVARGQA